MTPTPEQIKAAHEWCSAGEAAKEWACIDIQTQFVIYTAAAAYAAHCVVETKEHYQSEAYQVIGVLANAAGLFEHPEVQRALDYFSGNGDSILPFALPENAVAEAMAEKDAEIARLREALEMMEAEARGASLYCSICGSCGEEGCGCTHKCVYAFAHPDVSERLAKLEAVAGAVLSELSGNPSELRDQVASAIRGDGSDLCDAPWEILSDDRKSK